MNERFHGQDEWMLQDHELDAVSGGSLMLHGDFATFSTNLVIKRDPGPVIMTDPDH